MAEILIAAGVLLGLLAFTARLADARAIALRSLEGGALLLAALAYLAHLVSHRPSRRELALRSGLVTAFALWAVVQLEPAPHAAALLNDAAIILFIADLALMLAPWRLADE